MAHSWRTGPRPLTVLFAVSLASIAPESRAIALGEPEVRSALGENLDLRIPVAKASGESIEPSCFSLVRDPASTVPGPGATRISLERSAQGTRLRIRSSDPVNEPALLFGITAACSGLASEYRREYSIFLDPRPATAAVAVAPAAAAAPRSIAATLIARIGDTLESIANAIFPRNRGVKKSYIVALRETNPPLASLADNDPIAVDTPIALPDLRTFARTRPPSESQVARAAPTEPPAARAAPTSRATGPAAPRMAAAPRERPIAPPASPPPPREERAAVATALPPQRTARGRSSPGYQLKLSSVEVDLTRSRAIDDRSRAQLRDRQLVLDADDQVAAVLALRNSVRQLETRVAELQLKLAGMPAAFPPPKAEPAAPVPAPKPAEPPKAAPKVVEAPKMPAAQPAPPKAPEPVAPAAVAPPKPAPVEPAKTAPVEPPRSAVAQPPATPAPSATSPAPPPPKPATPSTRGPSTYSAVQRYWLWGLVVLIVAVTLLLVWRLVRRRREEAHVEEPDEPIVVAEEPERIEPVLAEEMPAAVPEPRSMTSDASLPTRLPTEGADDLRRRYIEERFPEIVNRTIVLDDPDSVVKAARLFYEDGALARAVELLHFAIERRPAEIKNWLALFEIFRLERLSGQFADLAFRFKERHGASDYWRKVQYFGREIDPGNTLYQDESFKSLETIGPSAAMSMAAEPSFDPVAENWLNAPMDFENEVLANELRKALMAEAGISELDLVPNPMPALRNVEMFTVA